jgi:hypothetical protein
MTVPYIFGSATSAIPLSQLDNNFATAITLGNTAVYLGNTTTSIGNLSLANVTISSVSTAITAAQGGTGLTSPGSSGNVLVSNGTSWTSNTLPTIAVSSGGTGQTSYTDGQLLIGNTTGNTLTKATLTAGSGITITNGSGSITIASSSGGSSVPINTDIAVTDYSLTLPSAIASTAGATVRTQTVALDATRELMLFVGASNLQAVVYDSSAGTFGTVVLVRTLAFTPQVSEFAAVAISSSSVLVCSLANSTTALSTVVLSISGSTITVNTAVATSLAGSSSLINANTRLLTFGSSYVLSYTVSSVPAFRAITVSGTTPTIGAELTISAGSDPTTYSSFAYTSSVLLSLSSDGATTLSAYPVSVSGTTLTAGTPTTISVAPLSASTTYVAGVLGTGRVAVAFQTSTGSLYSTGVISVTGTVASATTAGSMACSGGIPQMQVIGNQAFVHGGCVAGGNTLNLLTDTAGVASVGTGISLTSYSMVGYLSTGKVFLTSSTAGSSAYNQYGISGASAVLEKQFQTSITATTQILASTTITSAANYKGVLSGPPNSGNYYTSAQANLSLRTSTGKTAPMQSINLEFVVSIDGNTVGKIQQAGITITNNSVSDALSTATGWYVYQTLSATSLILNLRKMVLS